MKKICVGSEVFCWDRATTPVRGVVTEINALGFSGAVRCHLHTERISPDRVWISSQVYLYPEETCKLCGEMEDFAFDVSRKSKEIAAQEIEESPATVVQQPQA